MGPGASAHAEKALSAFIWETLEALYDENGEEGCLCFACPAKAVPLSVGCSVCHAACCTGTLLGLWDTSSGPFLTQQNDHHPMPATRGEYACPPLLLVSLPSKGPAQATGLDLQELLQHLPHCVVHRAHCLCLAKSHQPHRCVCGEPFQDFLGDYPEICLLILLFSQGP